MNNSINYANYDCSLWDNEEKCIFFSLDIQNLRHAISGHDILSIVY